MHARTVRSLSFASDLVRKVHSRASVPRSKKRGRLYRVTPSVVRMVIFARWNKNNGKPLIQSDSRLHSLKTSYKQMPGRSCRKGGKDVSKSVMHSHSCCRFSYQILIQLSPSSSADRSFSGPTFFDVENWVLLPENNKDFFCNLLVCSAMMSSRGRSPLVYKRNIIYIVSSRE